MRAFSLCVVTAAVGTLVMPVAAEPTKWSQVGILNCTMGPSIGLVIGDRQRARCIFKSDAKKLTDRYTGRIEREGSDAGIASGARFRWRVLTSTGKKPALSLVGRYTDATDQMTFEGQNFVGVALCSKASHLVCLRPAAREIRSRANLAFGTYALSLE
jgi:hypothetical protein